MGKNHVKYHLKKVKIEMSEMEFNRIELMLYLFDKTFEGEKAEDAWVIVTQYLKELYLGKRLKKYSNELYNLRRRCHKYGNKKVWLEALRKYKEVSKEIGLFVVGDDGVLQKNSANTDDSRFQKYDEQLQEDITLEKNDIKAAKSGLFKYYRKIRYYKKFKHGEEIRTEFKGEIPERLVGESCDRLPLYINKKDVNLPQNYSWKKLFESMPGNWSKRPEINLVNSSSLENDKLEYKNALHIIGGLGSGKSNYKIAETYRIVKEFNAKVGIVESNVANIIEIKRGLRELGLNVAVIIGKTNMEKHRDVFVKANARSINSIGDFGNEDYQELSSLSGNCLASSIVGDYDINVRDYPCKKMEFINSSDDESFCPLYTQCGYFQEARNLLSADVWIGTPHAILKSYIPGVIDPFKRIYFEAFYDLLDVIFVDEADSIQKAFDAIFIPTYSLLGGQNDLIEKYKDLRSKLSASGEELNDSRLYAWSINLTHLDTALLRMRRMIAVSDSIESFVASRTLTPYSVFDVLKNKLETDNANQDFLKHIKKYLNYSDDEVSEEFFSHDFHDLYKQLVTVQNYGHDVVESEKLISKMFEDYRVVIPSKNSKGKKYDVKLIYQQFELLIYLVQVDYNVRILNRDYPFIKEMLGEEYEAMQVFEGVSKGLLHFITEPMTGVIFGYKITKEKGKNDFIRIDLVRYTGVGRKLLEGWHDLKSEKGLAGPCVVFLSGTSYAPGSAHYHLNTLPNWILKSSMCEKQVFQRFLPKTNENRNGKLISISGVDDEQRNVNLVLLTRKCISDFEYELDYWKKAGEDRKILLIVNSYADGRLVSKELERTEFRGRYKVLDIADEVDSNTYERELLMDFAQTEADILIAPLIIIERGYNILKAGSERSYFGSVFFFTRPYMIPGDLEAQIQILHSHLPLFVSEALSRELSLGESMDHIRKRSYTVLNKLYTKPSFWKTLDDKEREIMSWFTLIPIKQTIGRLQRGGTDCRVFYIDGAFAPSIVDKRSLTPENSMLKAWENILQRYENDMLIKELYGEFFNGLKDAIADIDNNWVTEEYYEEEN